jgi:hypothetical protein
MMISKALIAALCSSRPLVVLTAVSRTPPRQCAAVGNVHQDDQFRSRPNTRGPSEGF